MKNFSAKALQIWWPLLLLIIMIVIYKNIDLKSLIRFVWCCYRGVDWMSGLLNFFVPAIENAVQWWRIVILWIHNSKSCWVPPSLGHLQCPTVMQWSASHSLPLHCRFYYKATEKEGCRKKSGIQASLPNSSKSVQHFQC